MIVEMIAPACRCKSKTQGFWGSFFKKIHLYINTMGLCGSIKSKFKYIESESKVYFECEGNVVLKADVLYLSYREGEYSFLTFEFNDNRRLSIIYDGKDAWLGEWNFSKTIDNTYKLRVNIDGNVTLFGLKVVGQRIYLMAQDLDNKPECEEAKTEVRKIKEETNKKITGEINKLHKAFNLGGDDKSDKDLSRENVKNVLGGLSGEATNGTKKSGDETLEKSKKLKNNNGESPLNEFTQYELQVMKFLGNLEIKNDDRLPCRIPGFHNDGYYNDNDGGKNIFSKVRAILKEADERNEQKIQMKFVNDI
jgi:hypothetical protein